MLVFFIIIIIVTILISSVSVGFKIENFRLTNYKEKNKDAKIFFLIYLFGIKIFSINIEFKDIKRIYSKENFRFDKTKKQEDYKALKKFLKSLEIKNILLNINIKKENVIVTTYIIVILSTILSYVFPIYIKDKTKESYFSIYPIYDNDIRYKIDLDCIIAIKTVYIIYIIYLILKKGRDEKYVRTSNRKSYESSYE